MDEWVSKPAAPALHPELGSLALDLETYSMLVELASKADDVVRAERYAEEAAARGLRLSRRSLCQVAWAHLRAGEPRRAHLRAEALIKQGSAERPNYLPAVVKQELQTWRSQRSWDPEEVVDLVDALARSLADSGNAATPPPQCESRCAERSASRYRRRRHQEHCIQEGAYD